MQVKEIAYIDWNSPISPALLTHPQNHRSIYLAVQQADIYWTEQRPQEKGRTVIVKHSENGSVNTITPLGFDVRSKVHEYGGLPFALHNENIYFVNNKDQRLYIQQKNETPRPLTSPGYRFADFFPTPAGILAVGEENSENFLAFINPATGLFTSLASGNDFYASPVLSPDGSKLAWITWNHPNMPWDSTQLWIADFHHGSLSNKRVVAGSAEESIICPQWSSQGALFFVSDRSGWWNLYELADHEPKNVCPMEAEFGQPLWQLGLSTWRFTGRANEILCTYQQSGAGKLALLNPHTHSLQTINLPYTDYSQITMGDGFAVFLAGSPSTYRTLIQLNLDTLAVHPVVARHPMNVDPSFFSIPVSLDYPSANGRRAYGYYYAPKNPWYKAPSGNLPPLLVMIHGGPTAAADPCLNLKLQYWTSRGWAVLDVNYGGSTGFGRTYRNSLKGQWGVVDIEDCEYGVRYLIERKMIDPAHVVIRGGSAGGYTVLAAMVKSSLFTAGAVYYGVTDLELLTKETHKFEKHYLDSLIGPYPAEKHLYEERSPINQADKIKSPVIFFQGGKDPVVPLAQAERMYAALQSNGIETKLIVYETEEHGFREAHSIEDALIHELQFYKHLYEQRQNRLRSDR